ncbi:hypothetical protein Bpfe_026829 [Biomphalaria pfeifferi]|uniref:Uncharacterized protein n=1 Tax=Biomphalaria pfeifferi TaxID=112525 RepID=A0AAD8EYV0_BIOPF|nr:hypothetical protein Bpfe_026829 [Biomphalaria pfeifferi]
MNTTTCKTGESMCTMLGKTDELIYDLLNKADEQMAIMSRRISDPLLIGEADNGSAVSDCGNEFCKRSSHVKKSDDCCEYHNDEHRPDHVHVAALTTRDVTYALRVRRLTSATVVKMERQRSRHRLETNLVNWQSRKRHLWMTLWGTRFLPCVAPTDRLHLH